MKRFIVMAAMVLAVSTSAWAQQVPEIVGTTPAQNALNAAPMTNIYLVFSQFISAASLNSSTILVYGSYTGYHTGSISYSMMNGTATFNPAVNFARGEVVSVSVTTGIVTALWGGIPLAENYVFNFTISGSSGGSGSFGAAVGYSETSAIPGGIRAADLDGDTDIDLVTKRSYVNNNIVTSWDNDGTGIFDGTNHSTNDTYDNMGDIVTVDLDWDNDIDVLVEYLDWSNYQSFSLAAVWNPFSTTIYPSGRISTAGFNSGYVAADFDGDGAQDILQTYHFDLPDKIRVWTNNGTGTLSSAWFQVITKDYWKGCAADFNNDGRIDFAAISEEDDLVAVWLNDGAAQFTFSADYDPGYHASDIHAADLNGDGDMDIVTANPDSDNITILFNAGTGTFGTGVSYDVGEDPGSLATADLDGDGDLDIATANFGSIDVSALMNDGLGGFGAPRVDFPCGSSTRVPKGIAAADLDGDGDIDLATCNGGYYSNHIYVLTNMPRPLVLSVSPDLHEIDVDYSTNITATFNLDMDGATINTSSFVVSTRTDGFRSGVVSYDNPSRTATFNPTADFDDGELVTVVLTPGIESADGAPIKSFVWNFTVTVDGGSGEFAANVEYGTGTVPRMVSASDFNHDGDIDLVVSNRNSNNLSVLSGNGDGTFASHVTYPAGNTPASVFAADLNGDGYFDLAVPNSSAAEVSVMINDGDGTFASPVGYAVYAATYCIDGGDLDGDGDIDLVVGSSTQVSVLLNDGDGTFAPYTGYASLGIVSDVCVFDYNSDGDLDVATARINDNYITLLANSGAGAFTLGQTCQTGEDPNHVFAADLDGDGDIDMAVTNRGDDNISVIKNIGGGTYTTQVIYAVGEGPVQVWAVDLDADGDMDLATSNYNSDDVTVLINDGSGVFSHGGDYGAGGGPFGIFSADFDEDTNMDLAVVNLEGNTVSVLLNLNQTVDDELDELPAATALYQNYPNPFNPATQIRYFLHSGVQVNLSVYDVLGRTVAVLVNGKQDAGYRTVTWNGKDSSGGQTASGVYFYKLMAGDFVQTRKMVLLR